MKKLLFLILYFILSSPLCQAQESDIIVTKTELNGITYYRLNYKSPKGKLEGIMNLNHQQIIPLSHGYEVAYPFKSDGILSYQVQCKGYTGLCDSTGVEIIPPSRKYNSAFYTEMDGRLFIMVNNVEGDYGICDLSGNEIISVNKGFKMVTFNFNDGRSWFLSESKDGKKGAYDMSGKEIIPAIYDGLFYDESGFVYKNKNGEFVETHIILNSFGIADSKAMNRVRKVEKDGFIWFITYQNGSFGAEDANGEAIIPLSRNYMSLYYRTRKKNQKGYFQCSKGKKEGVCTIDGKEILSPIYDGVLYSTSFGFNVIQNNKNIDTNIFLSDNGTIQKIQSQSITGNTNRANINGAQAQSTQMNTQTGTSSNDQKYYRIQGVNGGYTDCYPNNNGNTLMITHTSCFICGGTGRCGLCRGQGGINHPFLHRYIPCSGCASSGKCNYCQGKGEQLFSAVVDSNGNGFGMDMNGNKVVTGERSKSYDPNSNSNKSSSSHSSSNKNNDYIEEIYYSPNYTGEDNSEWCDICKKVAPAHKHIKKRF